MSIEGNLGDVNIRKCEQPGKRQYKQRYGRMCVYVRTITDMKKSVYFETEACREIPI